MLIFGYIIVTRFRIILLQPNNQMPNTATALPEMSSTITHTTVELTLPEVITFRTRNIAIVLYLITSCLVLASIYGDYLDLHSDANDKLVAAYMDFFYLGHEQNLPTLFSTCLLFAAAGLNLLIGVAAGNTIARFGKWYWYALCGIFMFLGLDESLEIHDRLNHFDLIQSFSGTSDFLFYSWVVPYAIGAVVIGLLFLRFVLQLPVAIRNRFFIAGLIYVGGALGFELAESYVHVHSGSNGVSMLERVLYTVEETMEMAGVILFIHALLDYITLIKARFGLRKTLKLL